jgi:hypothetical protein
MGFREQGVPAACYFGCPEINFPQLELASNTAERDIILAEHAGVSEQGMTALRDAAASRAVDAEKVTGPVDKLSAPWRPETPDAIRGKITPIECCRYAGIIALDMTGKTGTHRIRRPYPEANEQQETTT